MEDIKKRTVYLRHLNSVFRVKSRYALYDRDSGELLYSATYEITCRDKAQRMNWEIVSEETEGGSVI